ncbi:MAG TPA: pyridoxal phosphate-dependent aminotransferase [Chloroflexota bacterium]|nr:pyridoxal phosphate-dependent aminotransferase [Chloroflexota bacterium]
MGIASGRTFEASARARAIAPSASMALDAKAKALKAAGQPIISFGVGEPDFPTPEPVKDAASRALTANATHYTTVSGDPELRKLIAERTTEMTGVPYTWTQVIATSGAKEALYIAMQVLCDPGDEVLMPAPYWVSYAEQAKLAGGVIVPIDSSPPNWKLTPDDLRLHLTPRSRVLILCTPNNPTGAVYSDSELAALGDVLAGTDVAVIVDEIYARISYVPVGRWLRAAPHLAERSLIVDGVSKAYAMTGWRLGWLVGPQALMDTASALQSHLTSHPSSITQQAAVFALQGDATVEREVDAMVGTFRQRRDAIVSGLSAIEGMICPEPEGAFYVFPDVRGLYGRPLGPKGRVVNSANELAAYLLEDALVVTVPGEAFGMPGFVRFSYALGMDQLHEGLVRVQTALAPG